jgi:hypothetical protein
MKIGYFGALLCSLLIAHAEPYLAVQTGSEVRSVPRQSDRRRLAHGLRGCVRAECVMPQHHLDTGADTWVGEINRFLSVGGDLRFDGEYETTTRAVPSVDSFALEQARIYLERNGHPQSPRRAYVDEQVAPGGALNREAYGMYWSASHEWYLKAGQLYLPFGLRLQDQTAFIQTASGINMTTPDQGVEFGWEHNAWDAQFAVSNGTAAGPEVDHGKQYSGQLIYVEPQWRLGLGA